MRITGASEHAARLRRISGPEMVRELGAALFAAGDLIKVDAQISITNGAVSGKGHVPSRPGEPPKNDTGSLVSGIENELVAPLRDQVTSNAAHSIPLEFGTSKMAERPFMRPAAAKNRAAAAALVGEAVSIVVRKGS